MEYESCSLMIRFHMVKKKTALAYKEAAKYNILRDYSIGSSSSTCVAEFIPYATIDNCFLTSSQEPRPFRAR